MTRASPLPGPASTVTSPRAGPERQPRIWARSWSLLGSFASAAASSASSRLHLDGEPWKHRKFQVAGDGQLTPGFFQHRLTDGMFEIILVKQQRQQQRNQNQQQDKGAKDAGENFD